MCDLILSHEVLTKARELWEEDTAYWEGQGLFEKKVDGWDAAPRDDKLYFMKIAANFYLTENVIIDEDSGCFVAKTDF